MYPTCAHTIALDTSPHMGHQISAHSDPTQAPKGPVSPVFQDQQSVQTFEHTVQSTESEIIQRNRHMRAKDGTVSTKAASFKPGP